MFNFLRTEIFIWQKREQVEQVFRGIQPFMTFRGKLFSSLYFYVHLKYIPHRIYQSVHWFCIYSSFEF